MAHDFPLTDQMREAIDSYASPPVPSVEKPPAKAARMEPTRTTAVPSDARHAHELLELIAYDMEIFGADGKRVGQVKEIRDTDFLADRPMARDVYIPYDAVTSVGPHIRLTVTAVEVGTRDWPRPSLV